MAGDNSRAGGTGTSTGKAWAPALWRAIHHVALPYPRQHPTPKQQAAYRAFYLALADVIPCDVCADGYRDLVLPGVLPGGAADQVEWTVPTVDGTLPPLDAALRQGRLFEWTVQLHNAVNRKVGKPSPDWTPERARAALLQADSDRPAAADGPPLVPADLAVAVLVLAVGCLVALGVFAGLGRLWQAARGAAACSSRRG